MDVKTIAILVVVIFLLYTCKESIENFVTLQPPELPKKESHWDHNFAVKSHLRDDVVHENLLTNAFPMQKPPSTWEKTMSGAVDLGRADFIPKMRKVNS